MRAVRPVQRRLAMPGEADVREARRRADDAYRQWAYAHRELQAARRLQPAGPNADPDAQARIARLEAEEERLFAEAGELWRAYTLAQCAALWNSHGRLLPRGWLDRLERARRALREAVARPILPARRESRGAVQQTAFGRNFRNGGTRDLESVEGGANAEDSLCTDGG